MLAGNIAVQDTGTTHPNTGLYLCLVQRMSTSYIAVYLIKHWDNHSWRSLELIELFSIKKISLV
jgi:hypothetical protein